MTLGTARAAGPAQLYPEPDFYLSLKPHTDFYLDERRASRIEDMIGRPELFAPVTTKYIDFGLTQSRVWLKTSVRSQAGQSRLWRFDLRRQFMDSIDVWIVRSTGPPEKIMSHTGREPFSRRVIPAHLLVTDFRLAPGEAVDIYVAYSATATTFLPIGIGTVEATVNLHNRETLLNQVLNGALLTMIIMALFMTPVIRWPLSLSFSFYILAGLAYVNQADGYTFQYLFPNRPEWNDGLNLALMLMMSVTGPIFAKVLFDLKNKAPIWNKILNFQIALSAVFVGLALLFIEINWLMIIGYSLVPAGALLHFLTALIALRKRLLGGVPFTVGAIAVLLSIGYAFVAHIFPGDFNLDTTLDAGHFALIGECLAFTAAMVLRMQGLREDRDVAIQSELETAREKLDLADALQKTQADYIKARKLSDAHRNRLSNVSHDLQQPLNALRSSLQKLGARDEDTTAQIYAAFDYLETLANTEHTAGQSGGSATSPLERFCIKTVLDNVQNMFEDEARDKGLEFHYAPCRAQVLTDPVALMRIVSNLTANAVTYAQSGHVSVSAKSQADIVTITIADTGPGLSPADRDRVLARGETGEASKGSGLGLDIVSTLTKALKIDFDFQSEAGAGSRATLKLRLADDMALSV